MMILIVVCGFLLSDGVLASPVDRIVGGSIAQPGQYPYQASLRINNNHFCGGSVIGEGWILTAAHCLDLMGGNAVILNAKVVVGTNKISVGGQPYSINRSIPHEDYDPSIIEYDIGLLQLRDRIIMSNIVNVIPFHSSVPSDWSTCQLSGWGLISYPVEIRPHDLQHITLIVIPLSVCEDIFKPMKVSLTSKNLCTSGSNGKGACKGDSGGPLVSDGRQAGVVSWGIPCGKGYPDVYTSVPKFSSWITDQTGISVGAPTVSSQTFLVPLLISLWLLLHH